jgi:hypothetical protein
MQKFRTVSAAQLAFAVVLAALAACTATTQSVSAQVCASGFQWVGGDEGDELMHPGRDCIGCHGSGKGPSYHVAGTVFPTGPAKDDCFGSPGVTVRITGADGVVTDLGTNGSGNFMTKRAIATPYTAEVLRNGAVVGKMQTAQTSGACNSCHTEGGSPGRIVAP